MIANQGTLFDVAEVFVPGLVAPGLVEPGLNRLLPPDEVQPSVSPGSYAIPIGMEAIHDRIGLRQVEPAKQTGQRRTVIRGNREEGGIERRVGELDQFDL